MGLCKCERRKVTTLFCFEHHVNVCEHCLISDHSDCIVQSYVKWLEDSDRPSICVICNKALRDSAAGPCVRLICYDLFHWSCLDAHFSQLPVHTAPAGFVCPRADCLHPLFPPDNLRSPIADILWNRLRRTDWAQRTLSLAGYTIPSEQPPESQSGSGEPLPQNETEAVQSASESRQANGNNGEFGFVMINLPSGGPNKGDSSSVASSSTRQLTPIPPDAHSANTSLTASADHSSSSPFVPPPPPPLPLPSSSGSGELSERVGVGAFGEASTRASDPTVPAAASSAFDEGVAERERGTRSFTGGEASASLSVAALRSASQRSAASSLELDDADADTKDKYVKRYPFYMGVVRWLNQYMNVLACQRKVRTLLCGRRGRCCCWLCVVFFLLLCLYVLAVAGRQHASLDPSLNPFANPWLAKVLSSNNNIDNNNEPSPDASGGLDQQPHLQQQGAAHVQQIELPARDQPALLDVPPAAAHPAVIDPVAKKL